MTKLDVLDEFDEIYICNGYEFKGRRLKTFPTNLASLERITPVYERFEGWKTSLSAMTTFDELPLNARSYLNALAELSETRLWLVSVGPRRDQTIVVE